MTHDEMIKALTADSAALVQRAFAAGFKAGGDAMRQSILQVVAINPLSTEQVADLYLTEGKMTFGEEAKKSRAQEPIEKIEKARAPRGLINQVVATVLQGGRGYTLAEIEAGVELLDDRVARKSIYNHLHANRGTIYRLDGNKWFLRSPDQKEATGSFDPAADTIG